MNWFEAYWIVNGQWEIRNKRLWEFTKKCIYNGDWEMEKVDHSWVWEMMGYFLKILNIYLSLILIRIKNSRRSWLLIVTNKKYIGIFNFHSSLFIVYWQHNYHGLPSTGTSSLLSRCYTGLQYSVTTLIHLVLSI